LSQNKETSETGKSRYRNFSADLTKFFTLITQGKIKAQLPLKILFIYESEKLKPSEKVRFYYALKGRDGKSGLIKRISAEQYAKKTIICSLEHAETVQDFLKYWKLPYQKKIIFEADK